MSGLIENPYSTPPFDPDYAEACKAAYISAGFGEATSKMTAMLIQWPAGDTQNGPGPLHKMAKWPGPAFQPVDPDSPPPESWAANEPQRNADLQQRAKKNLAAMHSGSVPLAKPSDGGNPPTGAERSE